MLIKSSHSGFEGLLNFVIFVYMRTELYIGELLYRYNCVVVPEFGAFLSHMKSAVLHRQSNTFYPPSQEISFNEQLSSNDGLLVSYMANAEKTTYEDMLNRTLEVAESWKESLRSGERLTLENIGELWLSKEGKIRFQPTKKVNYLTSSFGLSSVVSLPVTREVLKEEVRELEEKIPFVITPKEPKTRVLRPYMKYAALFLLAVSSAFTAYDVYDNSVANAEWVEREAQEMVSRNLQQATFFETAPRELPPLQIAVTKRSTASHHIIAGAFRFKENADKKVRQLRRKGYDAAYLGTNPYGLHQVTYDSFTDTDEALEYLQRIKRTESRDAWLLTKRQ